MNARTMRTLLIALFIFALVVTGAQAAPEAPAGCKAPVTASEFRGFSARVWRYSLWARGDHGEPKRATIRQQRHKLRCAAGPDHRQAMRERWRKDKRSFYRYRSKIMAANINYTWAGAVFPESAWFALPKLKPYVAAALAEAAGDYTGTNMPGWTFMQVSLGEGNLRPGSRSTDDGWGWLAITRPFADHLGIHSIGGYPAMLNPVKNAYVAALMYGERGIAPWYGIRHVTCWDCHYRGRFDIRTVLGGETFGEALRSG